MRSKQTGNNGRKRKKSKNQNTSGEKPPKQVNTTYVASVNKQCPVPTNTHNNTDNIDKMNVNKINPNLSYNESSIPNGRNTNFQQIQSLPQNPNSPIQGLYPCTSINSMPQPVF